MQRNKGRAFVQELAAWLKTNGPKRRAVPGIAQLKVVEDWMNVHVAGQAILPGFPPGMDAGFREMRAARDHLARALPRLRKAAESFDSVAGLDLNEVAPELIATLNSVEWFLKEHPPAARGRPKRSGIPAVYCRFAAPIVIQAFQGVGWTAVSMKRRSSIGPQVVARMVKRVIGVDVTPEFVVAALRGEGAPGPQD